MTEETLTQILSTLTLISHIGLIIVLICYFAFKNKKTCDGFWNWIGKNGILFAFLIALASMIGSLYYSDVLGLEPCLMCWYARIAMYPLVFLLALAWFRKKDKSIIPYGILLAVIGSIINLYHTYLQFGQFNSVTCSPFVEVSCSDTYFVMFGYISFPVLSLTAFVLIIVALLFSKKHDK